LIAFRKIAAGGDMTVLHRQNDSSAQTK